MDTIKVLTIFGAVGPLRLSMRIDRGQRTGTCLHGHSTGCIHPVRHHHHHFRTIPLMFPLQVLPLLVAHRLLLPTNALLLLGLLLFRHHLLRNLFSLLLLRHHHLHLLE